MPALIAVIVGLYLFVMAVDLALGMTYVWAPPALLCIALIPIPAAHRKVSTELFRRYGIGSWASTDQGILASLRGNFRAPDYEVPLRWLLGLGALAVLGLWIFVFGYPQLCYAWSNNRDLSAMCSSSNGWVVAARTFLTLAPWAGVMAGADRLLAVVLVADVKTVHAQLSGFGREAEVLAELDRKIVQGSHDLGGAIDSRILEEWRHWISHNVELVLSDRSALAAQFRNQKDAAEADLRAIDVCVKARRQINDRYQELLARVTKLGSVVLINAVQKQIWRLHSDEIRQLVSEKRWAEIETFLNDVLGQLQTLVQMADEYLSGQVEDGSAEMDVESALDFLRLPRTCNSEDIKKRRREWAALLHPDRAGGDSDLIARNNRTMSRVNQACDAVLSWLDQGVLNG